MNYVADDTDAEPDCMTNDTDVCGVCGGPGMVPWYEDGDVDGLGDPAVSVVACTAPMSYVGNSDDLEPLCGTNDTDACGVCGGPGAPTWYDDTDGDGLGDPATTMVSCTQPPGYVADSSDTQPSCTTNDENICGQCGNPIVPTWYEDSDGDGLGDPAVSMVACSMPVGWVADNTDAEPNCMTNDTDVCGVCGGSGPTTWYLDEDGDGLGSTISTTSCGQPVGWVDNDTDPELDCTSNVVDACGDCDGPGMVSWHLDLDGDGHGTTGVVNTCPTDPSVQSLLDDDCDDTNPNRWDDCGTCTDSDGDGYGSGCSLGSDCSDYSPFVWSMCGGCDRDDADGDGAGAGCDIDDCDPTDTTIFEGAFEIPGDGIDQDCDGMDGPAIDPNDAVYVAVDCPNGPTPDDMNPGTPDAPVATIHRASQLAAGSRFIVAAGGDYIEGAFTISAIRRGLLGSYSCANGTWAYDGVTRTYIESTGSTRALELKTDSFGSRVVLHSVDIHKDQSSPNYEAIEVDNDDGEVFIVDVNASSEIGRVYEGYGSGAGRTMISNSSFHSATPEDTPDEFNRGTFYGALPRLFMSGSSVTAGPMESTWTALIAASGQFHLYDNVITGGSTGFSNIWTDGDSTLRANTITAGVSNDGNFTSTGASVGSGSPAFQIIDNTISASTDPSAQVTLGAYVLSDQGETELRGNFIDGGGGSISAVGLEDHDNGGPISWGMRSYNNHYQAGVSVASAGTVTGAQINRGLWSANDVFIGGAGAVSSIGLHVVRADDTVVTHCVAEAGDGASSYALFNDMSAASQVYVENCVLMSTGGTSESYAVYANTSGSFDVNHNDLWPSSGATSTCLLYDDNSCLTTTTDVTMCLWDGCSSSFGNISADPQIDASYHITSAMSPLVDGGYLNFVHFPFGDIDIDDEDRFFDVAPDIGIDEYTP